MAGGRYVLGVDSSTTATKAVAFDSVGRVAAEAVSAYGYSTRKPGWAEQDPMRWWNSFCEVCGSVTADLGDPSEIGGLAITHQRFSFCVVDRDMAPLYPAILWNDTRCDWESEFARSKKDPAHIFSRTGFPPGQWSLYKLLWLNKHEPAVYDAIHRMVLVPDYLNWRLTGELSTSQSSAAMTGALDIAALDVWAKDVIRDLGVRDDIWVERILPGAAGLGAVTRAAAADTGLPEGLPVYAAAGDQPCGSLASGVNRRGLLGINGGTSCSSEFLVGALPPRDDPDYFVELSPTGDYIVENDIPSGGSAVMSWYRDHFAAVEEREAEAERADPWDVIFAHLDATPAGNRGLMIVPYLQAVYGPYWNQNARGVVAGLHRDHTRGNLVRALLEGVAYEARREVELMTSSTGVELEEIRMYGGSAKNDRWNQLFADVFGVPVRVAETAEATALGAAMCASVGCGMHGSFDEADEAMVRLKGHFDPEPTRRHLYDRYFSEVYIMLYDRVADLHDTIADINKEAEDL
jgi:sugar (pentulose or hexulose) kinase